MVTAFNHDEVFHGSANPISSRIEFPYLTISQFAKAFKDYIHFGVYDGFKGFIYAEYNKGIQTVMQMMDTTKEGDLIDYGLPLFNYDIQLEGPVKEVESYWRTSNLTVSSAKVIYEPFYSDDELETRIVYRRMQGTITSTIYCSSQPQEIDIQMAFIDAFKGMNRWVVTPIRAFTVIPEKFLFRRVDGTEVTKAVDATHITRSFINAVNKHCYYIGTNSSPLVRLTSITPSNTLYGGKDLPQFALSANFEFEIEVPQYILANAVINGKLVLDISLSYEYEKSNRFILNTIFGNIKRKESHEGIITCENGQVIGTNAIVVDTDTLSTLDFDVFYPKPRNFIPVDKYITIYLDTPIGVLTEANGNFKIVEDKATNKYTLTLLNNVSFQKDDLVTMYVFRPNDSTEDDS